MHAFIHSLCRDRYWDPGHVNVVNYPHNEVPLVCLAHSVNIKASIVIRIWLPYLDIIKVQDPPLEVHTHLDIRIPYTMTSHGTTITNKDVKCNRLHM